jgi:hypothetical protein
MRPYSLESAPTLAAGPEMDLEYSGGFVIRLAVTGLWRE